MSTKQIALLATLLLGLFTAGGYLFSVATPETGQSCRSSAEHERNVEQTDVLQGGCPDNGLGDNPNALQTPDND